MFELPDLAALSAAELDELLAAVRDEAATLSNSFAAGDDVDLDYMETLAAAVESITGAQAVLATAATERAERLAAINARIAPVAEVEAEVEAEIEEAVAEVVAEAEAIVEAEAAPVVAAVNSAPVHLPKPSAKAVAARAPKPAASAGKAVAIVAAAGVPGIRGGSEASIMDFVKPALSRWGSYQGVSGRIQDELFSLKAPARDPRLVANGHNDQDVMAFAVNQSRLTLLAEAKPGQDPILAAGGWCAPAEQKFDICTLADLDGILDVPTIGMPRGSISYFRHLDYATVAAAIAAGEFCFTNAQLVAEPPVVKPCFEIPCATPVEATLDACGLCLRAGLLQQKAFPELIAAWLELALIAHAHFLNARNIAQMVAGSGAPIVAPQTFGAISEFLNAVALQATAYRLANGMSEGATLELVAPFWLPNVLWSDSTRRQFNDDAYTAADLRSDLAALNVRAQFVKDFQDAEFIAAAAAGEWPGSVNVLLFAPGAWVRGAEDIISVSTLVDSTLLQTNRTQLLFIEAATVMLPYCGPSELLSIPLCPSGATAGPIAATPGTFTCA